jgi:type IV pilus assembly protein PilB
MHLRPLPPPDETPGGDPSWDGVTHPRGLGGRGRFLTDVIVEMGVVARDRVEDAIAVARQAQTTPERLLIERGDLSADTLARAIAERHGLDHVDLTVFSVDFEVANLITTAVARRYEALPVARSGERMLLVAMADPANVRAIDDLAVMTGCEIRPLVASSEDIAATISRLGQLGQAVNAAASQQDEDSRDRDRDTPAEVLDLRESADDAPVIKLVDQIIGQAVEQGASDIHLEPDGTGLRVRFRIDGVLAEAANVPRRMIAGVISRVKIMSELDIAERRVPQDGRVGLEIEGRHIDLRVVTLPSVHGESIVIRILDKDSVVMDLDRLGMSPPERDRFRRAYGQAFGAVLVTGPTGSGKSTSLYAALGELNTPEKNIITIEDPVEFQVNGITQVQVNAKAGLHFATGLRSMMRADPDVIMVGEIRDRETAQIAVESALTGHLVLSTLHTNDAPTAITRLIEMGIEPFLIASALDCVVAQRLARTLCAHCKRRTIISSDVLRDNGFPAISDVEAYEPVGCARCNNSGYKGRIGLYEVMTISEAIRALIIPRAGADEVSAVAASEGMRRLREDGLEKVRLGVTSVAEVARVTGTTAA